MRARRRSRGQAMVEFALVFPMVITLCLGLISGSWLFWQGSALSDGAKGGVRAASIMSAPSTGTGAPLDFVPSGSDPCASFPGGQGWNLGGESGSPEQIEVAVGHDANQVTVSQKPLCVPSNAGGGVIADSQYGGSITPAIATATNSHALTSCGGANPPIQLRQLSPAPGQAQIYVDAPAGSTLCNASSVILVAVRTSQGLAPPLSVFYAQHAVSQMPCSPRSVC
jgi:hypothetical protein